MNYYKRTSESLVKVKGHIIAPTLAASLNGIHKIVQLLSPLKRSLLDDGVLVRIYVKLAKKQKNTDIEKRTKNNVEKGGVYGGKGTFVEHPTN